MANSSIAQNNSIFQAIREGTTFPEVFQAFNGGEMRRQGRFFVALCPFHTEKTASFTIYPDGFKCFGCSEYGDSITFVSKLLGLRPLDAARAISEKFGLPMHTGPLTREDRLRLSQAKAERLQRKKIEEAFRDWCKSAIFNIRTITEAVRKVIAEKGPDIAEGLLPLINDLPRLEHIADTLCLGTDEEKLELYRIQEVRRWA